MKPHYHFPLSLLLPHIPSFLLGRRRSLHADFNLAFDALHTAPRVIDGDHISRREPFVVVFNHYHQPDIPSWWFAMAVCKAIADQRAGHAPHEPRMLIASQWTYNDALRRLTVEPVMRFIIGRIIRVYNHLPMAPMAMGEAQTNRRAQSIRHVLAAAKQAKRNNEIIGIAPEGGDTPGGVMTRPPVGAGRFLLLVAAVGLPFLPAGVYAEDGLLVAHFGPPFELSAPTGIPKAELDEWALRESMGRIARLIPENLRGVYRDAA